MLKKGVIPADFRAVMDEDEVAFWYGRPKLLPFLSSGFTFLAFGMVWGAIDYFFFMRGLNLNDGPVKWFFAIHLFPFYGGILNMLRLFLIYNNTSYTYTDKRLIIRTGFLGTGFKSIDYDSLFNLHVSVNPVELFSRTGTIYISSMGESGRFIGIENPYEVYKNIKKVSLDVRTDMNYPNALRPDENPGYKTRYKAGKNK